MANMSTLRQLRADGKDKMIGMFLLRPGSWNHTVC